MIKGYYTDNGIFDSSKFMEEMLKKKKKIRFNRASASHQNGAAERTTKTVVIMASAILMQAWMICHKDTLSIGFGQHWGRVHELRVHELRVHERPTAT